MRAPTLAKIALAALALLGFLAAPLNALAFTSSFSQQQLIRLTSQNTIVPASPGWTFASTSIGTNVAGILPIANGGSATSTFQDKGAIFYNAALGALSQNGALNFDYINGRLLLDTSASATHNANMFSRLSIATGDPLGGAIANGADPAQLSEILTNFASTNGQGTGLGFLISSGPSQAGATAGIGGYRTGSSGQGGLWLGYQASTTIGAKLSIGIVMDQNGKVGIGTTTPVANLQVTATGTNSTSTSEFGKDGQSKGDCMKRHRLDGTAVYTWIDNTNTQQISSTPGACATITGF